jgi:hypothetical protein
MRKKERFISVLLMGALAFSLAACTGTKESSSAAASSSLFLGFLVLLVLALIENPN